MATKSISQLDTAESLALGDLFEIAIPDGNSATGYSSRKTSLTNIAEFTQSTAANNSLETTAKTIVGAINEEDSKKFSWEENKASGVKNYFVYPFYTHPRHGEEYTVRDITFTDNGDGGIRANGTNNGTGISYCQALATDTNGQNNFCTLPPGKYLLTGGISEDFYMSLSYALKTSPTNRTIIGYDYGGGLEFEVTESDSLNRIYIAFTDVASGKTANNIIFYPMIKRLDDTSIGFKSYAMTNQLLTQLKVEKASIAPTETTGTASRAYAVGEYMFWRSGFYKVTAPISANGAITDGTNVTLTTIGAELKALFDALS